MTKKTAIEKIAPFNVTGQEKFLCGIRDLCHHYYLPFTTKAFTNQEDIIKDFLETLLKQPLKDADNKPLIQLEGLLCIVPTFYYIEHYHTWKIKHFEKISVLSKIHKTSLLKLYAIQEKWSSAVEHRLSATITKYLNKEECRNGRLKLRITLSNTSEIKITYENRERMLVYEIPTSEQSKWVSELNVSTKVNDCDCEIFDLEKGNLSLDSFISSNKFSLINTEDTPDSFKSEPELWNLAKDLFEHAVQHSLYLTAERDLIYIFSSNMESVTGNSDVGLGGMFILVDNRIINGNTPEGIKIINFFSRLTDALSSRLINFYHAQEILNLSRRAAISQVMSRNMSHNLGSHVLANLTIPQVILNIALDNNHDDLKESEEKITYLEKTSQKRIAINNKPKSFHIAIAELNTYLRTRMDFLADISTGTAVIETQKYVSSDVIKPLEERNILLKRFITGTEKTVTYKNPSQLIVSFPNDNLGVQALYILIENVVRNSAKHGKGNSVCIDWKTNSKNNNDYIEFIIYDKNDEKSNDGISQLVMNQQERINKPILENGSLRAGSWGMLEMKIAAAYLRKKPIEDIDKTISLPLLQAVAVDNKFLGYKLYLLKPKNILVIQKTSNINEDISNYVKNGIHFISLDQLKHSTGVFGHELAILSDIDEGDIATLRKRLPLRIVQIGNELSDDLSKLLDDNNAKNFIDWAWKQWFDILVAKTNPIEVCFFDDESNGNAKTINLGNKDEEKSVKAHFVYHCNQFRDAPEYFEPYYSLHAAKKEIEELKNYDGNELFHLKSRFIEVINYNVVIVDERIQRHSQLEYDGGISNCTKTHKDFMEKCGMEVPDVSINLNEDNFNDELKKNLKEWIESKVETTNFLVIHIGIIEKLLGLETLDDQEKQGAIENYLFLLRNLYNRKAKLIITSGRGQPESLPKGERFVHYSNIAQYVIEKRSKYHLIQLLMSARETK